MLVNIFTPHHILSSFKERDRIVFALILSYFLMHGSCVETVLVKAKTPNQSQKLSWEAEVRIR